MIPIYEQGRGQGIGYNDRSFSERFEALCREHLEKGRARAFAFIFYDFCDSDFRKLLKNQGVFAELDRLAGSDLSIFYLHSATRRTVDRFNSGFLTRLGIAENVQLPCVVFFRVKEDKIDDVVLAQLERADLIHGFRELYDLIEDYINEALDSPSEPPKYLKWVKSGVKFIGLEGLRAFIKLVLDSLF